MTETQIQKKIKDKLNNAGWAVLRLRDVDPSGMPDLLAYRERRVIWIEVKTPDGIVSEMQKYRHIQLSNHGQEYYIMDSCDNVQLQLLTQ